MIIDGKTLEIYDDVISNNGIIDMIERVKDSWFKRNEWSTHDHNELRHYAAEFELSIVKETEVYHKALELIEKTFGPAKLTRAYINAETFGDCPVFHQDGGDYTALYYIVDQWNRDWDGATVFMEDNNTGLSVLPMRGRLVIFDSKIWHVGRAPTKICYDTRYTLALKFNKQ